MSYTKKLVFGTALVIIFSIFSNIFTYILRIILARELSVVEFGFIYALFSFFGLFSILQHMGLQEALTKFIPNFLLNKDYKSIKSSIKIVFWIQFASSLILIFIIIILIKYNILINILGGLEITNKAALLFAFSILFSAFELVFLSVFTGFHKPMFYSFSLFLRYLMILCFTLLFIKLNLFDSSIIAVIYAHIFVYVILIVDFYFLKKVFPKFFTIKSSYDSKLLKKLIGFGLPVILTSAAGLFINYTDTLLITWLLNLKEAGLYNAAVPTSRILWILPASFSAVLLPIISELSGKKEKHLISNSIKQIYKYSLLIIIPPALIFLTFPELVLNFLFGSNYVSAAQVLGIMAIGSIFYTLVSINYCVFSGIGKPLYNTYITISAGIINILLSLFLIPKIGIIGAAISTTASFFIMMIISIILLKKERILENLPYIEWIKNLIIGIIFIIVIGMLKKVLELNLIFEFLITVIVGLIIYLILAFVLKITSITEIKEIIKRLKA